MARSSVSHSRAARGTRTSPLVCRAALIMFGVVSSLNGALLFRSRRSIHTCTRTAGLPGLVAAFAPPSVRSSVRLPQQQHQHPPRRWLETAVTTTSKTTQSGRWRSPQLSQMQSERRTAPRLYKRTLLRGKKKAETGDMLFRADRVLANRTGKSRKECFQLLQEKRVFRVLEDEESLEGNVRSDSGSALDSETPYRRPRLQVVAGPAAKLSMKAALRIDKYEVVPSPPPLLAVYHKPKWVLSVRRDPTGRPCIDEIYKDMHPVGRLDYDTTGLLLFSTSGPLTQSLLHPKRAIEKEYVATVTGTVDQEALAAKLAAGVKTGEGVHTAQLLSVEHFPENQVADYLEAIRAELPSQYNQSALKERGYLDVLDAVALSTVTLTVSEGKHRMVRRMLANTGHPVVSLHRERLGLIKLNDLPVGKSRELSSAELKWAHQQLRQGKQQEKSISEIDDEPLK